MFDSIHKIIKWHKTSVVFMVFLAAALSFSCAGKKTAIEQLIVQKAGPETQRKVEEEINKNKKDASIVSEKETQDKDERKTKKDEKKLDIFSRAILDVKEEAKETNKGKQSHRYVFIARESVNLRSGPGVDFPVVGKAKRSDKFQLVSISNEKYESKPWYEIKISPEAKAYVWSDLALVLEKYVEDDILPDISKNKVAPSNTSNIGIVNKRKIPTPSVPDNMGEEYVSLNFESTDLKDIIITFCELLKVDYILDPNISGKITLQTFKKVHIKDLFQVLEKILILNNLTVIKTGNFYRFMPIEPAKKETFHVFVGKDGDLLPPIDRLIVQIIPLKHVTAVSMKRIIKPLLSKRAQFLDVPDTNNLIVIDTANNVKRILDIVAVLDISTLDKLQVKLFPIEFSSVIELASELQEIFTALGYASKDKATVLKFVPILRLNSLMVVSNFPDLIDTIKFWISNLDKPIIAGLEKRTYVYYVQNAKADQLAGILNQLYQVDKSKINKTGKRVKKSKVRERIARRKSKPGISTKAKSPLLVEVKSIPQGELSGEIFIIPDQFTNSLLIRTDPGNYPAILDTIKYLDLMPLQVLIELVVLELTIDDQTRAGLDWAIKSNSSLAIGSSSTAGLSIGETLAESATSLLAQGFSFVATTDKMSLLFQAFSQDSKINVLSNPVLITSENMPASINITNEIPIESTTISTPTAGQPLTQTTIQYKSVGIKLEVTPQINKDRFVTMQINQEVSNVNEASSFTQPSFFTRSTQTTVVVKDNQTLVIGGLMETQKSESNVGVPILKDIPLFGYFFKAASKRVRKTELMIFITPHVIANISEAESVTQDFQSRLLNLKPDLIKKK